MYELDMHEEFYRFTDLTEADFNPTKKITIMTEQILDVIKNFDIENTINSMLVDIVDYHFSLEIDEDDLYIDYYIYEKEGYFTSIIYKLYHKE